MTTHKDERTITPGITIAGTTADTTMAATAIAGHIKRTGHNKHVRGTLKVGFYLYLPVCTTIILLLTAPKWRRRPTLLQQHVAKPARACIKLI
jgi:hypothetical protein